MEHKAAVRRGDRNNGSAVHAWDEDHRIDWEGANIKEVKQQLCKRQALEASGVARGGGAQGARAPPSALGLVDIVRL